MIAGAPGAKFAFTKLVVHDLHKAAAFYRAVCEYGEGQIVKAAIAGRPVEEIIFRAPERGIELVLLTFLEEPPPSPNGVITAFDTPDLNAFQERLLNAGGTVVEPIKRIEFGANRMQIGFFADPEGFLLEVMER